MGENKAIQKVEQNQDTSKMEVFGKDFERASEMARCLSDSSFVPDGFRNSQANCFVALDLALRIGLSPIAVMQNMYVVHGRPGLEAKFVIACVNTCGKFSPLRFRFDGDGDDYGCRAVAVDKATGEELQGTKITWAMVVAEGWNEDKKRKDGGTQYSKWNTMQEQMFKYRAASFWQREFAPELTMGIPTVDEVHDVINAGAATIVSKANPDEDPLAGRGDIKVTPSEQPAEPQQNQLFPRHKKVIEENQ